MAGSQNGDLKMEGWLYIIRSNRIGLQYSRKRYFVLEDHLLKSFKSIPISNLQVSSFFLVTPFIVISLYFLFVEKLILQVSLLV